MADVTVVILTYNEELHIERCIRSVQLVAEKIIVVDSFSTDRTVELARAVGAEVVQHEFTNQATQFNWALENLPITTPWVMRMDADEYLEPELQEELPRLLARLPHGVDGVYLKRKVFFHGKWIRHGGFYPQILLRIWRTGKGHLESRWMDEHAVLQKGAKTVIARGHLVDNNLKGITFWIDKHNKFASREAADMLNLKYPLFTRDESIMGFRDPQARRKRVLKEKIYARLPIALRAFLYFLYRYLLKLGFLDGSKGFIYHFMQAFWYRLLVDIKIVELQSLSKGDPEAIKKLLRERHGLKI